MLKLWEDDGDFKHGIIGTCNGTVRVEIVDDQAYSGHDSISLVFSDCDGGLAHECSSRFVQALDSNRYRNVTNTEDTEKVGDTRYIVSINKGSKPLDFQSVMRHAMATMLDYEAFEFTPSSKVLAGMLREADKQIKALSSGQVRVVSEVNAGETKQLGVNE